MTKHQLKCSPRTITGRKVKQLRSQGFIPANVFGKNLKSKNIQVNAKEFSIFFKEVGESTLSYLEIEGEKETLPVFVSQLVKDPISGETLHVAFHQVDLKEKVSAPVPLVLVGEAAAEKDKLGIMVQQLDEIEVEALPTNMPENIQIDISGLAQVGDNIFVKDIKIDSSKLEVLTDPETIVVQIEALAKEEVQETPAAEAETPATEAETPETKSEPATEEKEEK